jgi:hypothetical protein
MKRSAPEEEPTNAFAVLMSGKKKKRPSNNCRFVLCPAGCGKRVADLEINAHLDSCMQAQAASSAPETSVKLFSSPPKKDSVPVADACATKPTVSLESKELPNLSKTQDTKKVPEHANAFAHMMKRSSQVFSQSEPQKLSQRLHLCANGRVTLTCYSSNPGLSQPDNIQWSATANVKDRKQSSDSSAEKENPRTVELIVSSSIPSAPVTVRRRLVQKHSRLSVPVLKSILQKSMRRRKPLPCVRIAMELMDKSLGDLLRRLPIIIFEDSTLHPELPLLIWLMVAHSKDFELPLDLITKVLRVVFEVASCPRQDLEMHQDETPQNRAAMLSIGSFHKAVSDNTPCSVSDTMIWSTLLRAQYGGMAGDIRMLRHFAEVWNERFSAGAVPTEIQLQLVSTKENVANLRWCDLPTLIHQSSSLQSDARVAALANDGFLQLSMADLSIEGIDFHCSPGLHNIIADRELVETYLTRSSSFHDTFGRVPSTWDER